MYSSVIKNLKADSKAGLEDMPATAMSMVYAPLQPLTI